MHLQLLLKLYTWYFYIIDSINTDSLLHAANSEQQIVVAPNKRLKLPVRRMTSIIKTIASLLS